MTALPHWLQTPRAAYVHVPFCLHRCGYCDFTLVAGRDDLIPLYLTALQRELDQLNGPFEVDTLFLGGGTPSHLPPMELQRMFALLRETFSLTSQGEFSLEANPEGLSAVTIDVLQAAGVNRLSLGVQSFDPEVLRTLERNHTPHDIAFAVKLARKLTANVSLDLIFGVPGQSCASWSETLEAALSLEPTHISTYGLTFEKGTTFWGRLESGLLAPVDDALERDMYQQAIDRLTSAGFQHYEISNFARPGCECRHNLVYWNGGPYFGVGPGAASYRDGVRRTNLRSVTSWIRRVNAGKSPVGEEDAIDPLTRAREAVMLGLRKIAGLDVREFRTQYGFDPLTLGGTRGQEFLEMGWLELEQGCLRLTREGRILADTVLVEFM